jgi:hypothetical protein
MLQAKINFIGMVIVLVVAGWVSASIADTANPTSIYTVGVHADCSNYNGARTTDLILSSNAICNAGGIQCASPSRF